MRLQSAIFTLEDTLFTPDGTAREGLDKALALFKMEGVAVAVPVNFRVHIFRRILGGAKLYVRGTDLFSIDNLEVSDPESYGVSAPLTRSIVAGLALTF